MFSFSLSVTSMVRFFGDRAVKVVTWIGLWGLCEVFSWGSMCCCAARASGDQASCVYGPVFSVSHGSIALLVHHRLPRAGWTTGASAVMRTGANGHGYALLVHFWALVGIPVSLSYLGQGGRPVRSAGSDYARRTSVES